jgi:hypothetical protein
MTGCSKTSKIEVEVGLVVENATAGIMLAALLVDDFSGLGVQVRSTAEGGRLTYTLTFSCDSVYRAKSIVNELLRLIKMLQETHTYLGVHGLQRSRA